MVIPFYPLLELFNISTYILSYVDFLYYALKYVYVLWIDSHAYIKYIIDNI